MYYRLVVGDWYLPLYTKQLLTQKLPCIRCCKQPRHDVTIQRGVCKYHHVFCKRHEHGWSWILHTLMWLKTLKQHGTLRSLVTFLIFIFVLLNFFLEASFQRVTTFLNSSRNELSVSRVATDKTLPRETGEGSPRGSPCVFWDFLLQCNGPVLRPPMGCSYPEQLLSLSFRYFKMSSLVLLSYPNKFLNSPCF